MKTGATWWRLAWAVALSAVPLCAGAQSVSVVKGDVFFQDAAGRRMQLTREGRDSAPCLDPQKRRVVFVRATPGKLISTGSGDVEASGLRVIDADGKKETLLARGVVGEKMENVLAGFASPQFSPDGKTIYFESAAWATSGAVHAVSLVTGKVRFVCAGDGLEVVPGGEYAGDLLVVQHRYFLGGGSYDWYYLLKPDGKEVGVVGETTENFKKAYLDEAGR